jgi:ribosome-interacting GTPase 1
MPAEKIVEIKGGGQNLSLQQIRSRIATYESELRQFLDSHQANVETYKFSVEKEGDGFSVEVDIKASLHPRAKAVISK